MTLYKTITDYYQQLFPLKEVRLAFIHSYFTGSPLDILDIGCATGQLALSLADCGHHVTGIDLDAHMVERAKENVQNRKHMENSPTFFVKDMTRIADDFEHASFDMLSCFGNTVAHLDNLDVIEGFLEGVFNVLKPGGVFLMQIVNFDRVLAKGVTELPLLETEDLVFRREYDYDISNNKIRFITCLTAKNSQPGKLLAENTEILFPLTMDQLKIGLKKAGTWQFSFFGTETKTEWSLHSPATIVAAVKNTLFSPE